MTAPRRPVNWAIAAVLWRPRSETPSHGLENTDTSRLTIRADLPGGDAMPDNIRSVQYFKMTTPDKPGEGARVLARLRDAGVDLLAFSGFPQGRRGQLDFVPADAGAFK